MAKLKKFCSQLWQYCKRPFVWGGILILVAAYFIFSHRSATTVQTLTIQRGDITQTVVVTGQIVAAKKVSLSFQQTGNIARIYVQTGERVKSGEALIAQDASTLQAQLDQAQASLAAAQANLAILQAGATPQDIAVAQTAVQTAAAALISAIRNAYTAADDAVHNEADTIFTNPRTDPQLIFSLGDLQLTINVKNERLALENALASWQDSVSALNTGSDLASAASSAIAILTEEQNFLTDAAAAVNQAMPSAAISPATITNWKTNIAAGRTEVSTAITNVNAAAATLAVNQKQLVLKEAPPTREQIAAAEAAVAQAQAQVQMDQTAIAKTVLYAPFDALVTNVVPQIGETVMAGEEVVDLIGLQSLEVEAYVPEVDVAKLAIGDKVSMTFDALPNETFTGKVITIYPAETVINGVANYKVEVAFDKMDPRFKSGLTANLTIETLKKENVLILPQYALIENDQGTFVKKIENGKPVQVPVTLGIRDDSGNAEVLSGLQAGDQVENIGLNP